MREAFKSSLSEMFQVIEISHFAVIANVIQMAVHNRLSPNMSASSEHSLWNPGQVALGGKSGSKCAVFHPVETLW